jgi:RNA polymerase sigma-70 factor (ECF subfamily)
MASSRKDRVSIEARDTELLNRIRCGDHDALRELFYHYFSELVIFARRQLRVPSEAPDVVQDVFASLWHRRGVLDLHAAVSSYLYGAVRLRSRDVRVHQVLVEKYMVDSDANAGKEYERVPASAQVPNEGEERVNVEEVMTVVEHAVRRLPDRTQEVYRLSRYHNLSHKDIAVALDLSPNTVNVQMSRALRAIARALGQPNPNARSKPDADSDDSDLLVSPMHLPSASSAA